MLRAIKAPLVILFVLALTLAVSAPTGTAYAKSGPDMSIDFVRAHVTIDSEGMFVIDRNLAASERKALQAIFDPLNANLASVDRNLRPTIKHQASKGPGMASTSAMMCGYLPRWALEAFAWYLILTGAVVSFVGIVADATILGLPAGAVLGALGIAAGTGGSYLLWWVDSHIPPWGIYLCV